MDNPTIRFLSEEIRNQRVFLFIGAGLSIEAGCPSANGLAHILAAELEHTIEPDEQLGMISEYYETAFPGRLIPRLARILESTPTPAESHLKLASLPWATIFTTNYDTLIESAYEHHGKPLRKIVYPAQLGVTPPQDTTLVKLHGCISPPYRFSRDAPLVITDKDYELYLGQRQLLIRWLTRLLLEGYIVLFVGYSVRDPYWQTIRLEVSATMGRHMPAFYAVMPTFSEHRRQYWQSRGVHLIQATGAQVFDALAGIV